MKVDSPLVLGVVTAAAAAVLLTAPSAASAYGLTSAGRVEKCRGDEACISTSSVSNPSKFGPPWTFAPQTSDPETAWAALKDAVESNPDHGRIVESLNGPKEFYLRAEFPSFPKGVEYVKRDVEFRLIPSEALVTYRSASRDALFIYPLQTPIDIGKNQSRLNQIRQYLGWSELDGDIKSSSSTKPSPSPDFLPDFD